MKHGVIIVLSLILALCLMGVVSANDNVTVDCDNIQITQEDVSIEAVEDSGIKDSQNEICSKDYSSGSNDDLNDDELSYSNVEEISDCENSDLIGPIEIIDAVEFTGINEENTEIVLDEINNSPNGYVNYDNGNLLMLPLNDLNDESLMITFQNEENKLLLSGNNGLTDDSWNNFQPVGIISEITSQSSKSFDKELLSTGFISNQENYPQKDLPLEDTLLGISGDSDNDAFIWSAQNPDEKAFFTVDKVNETDDGYINISEREKDLSFILGRNASLKALDYFKSQGINIEEGYPDLYVLTSAGMVNLNGTSTYGALIAISMVLGYGLNENIIPIQDPLWQDLIFYFIWINSADKKDISSYALKYDEKSSELVESDEIKSEGDNIAYAMGLYEKSEHPDKPDSHKRHCPVPKHLKLFNVIGLVNATNVTNTTNNVTNATIGENKKDEVPKFSVAYDGNPFNILYIIISIIMVSIIFGVGYSRRT